MIRLAATVRRDGRAGRFGRTGKTLCAFTNGAHVRVLVEIEVLPAPPRPPAPPPAAR